MRELGVRCGVWGVAVVAWSVACAALLPAGRLCAQEVDRAAARRAQARVAADLAHEIARIVAAAARAAQRAPARELVPALVGALRRWRGARGEHADLVCLFVLDALLANGARVDAADLEGLWDGVTGEVALALVCRESRANEAVLRRLWDEVYWPAQVRLAERQEGTGHIDPRCVLVGGLLAAQRAPGFAAQLWRKADLRLRVVVDEGETFGAAPFEVVLSRREVGVQDPELRRFRLSPLMAGRQPQQIAGELLHVMASGGGGDRRRGGVWSALTECRPEVGDAGKYREQVKAAQARLRVALAALRERLVRAGALTGEEAGVCAVEVEIVVEDRRQGRRVPLPEVEEGR